MDLAEQTLNAICNEAGWNRPGQAEDGFYRFSLAGGLELRLKFTAQRLVAACSLAPCSALSSAALERICRMALGQFCRENFMVTLENGLLLLCCCIEGRHMHEAPLHIEKLLNAADRWRGSQMLEGAKGEGQC